MKIRNNLVLRAILIAFLVLAGFPAKADFFTVGAGGGAAPLSPLITATTPQHSALNFGNSSDWIINLPLRSTDLASACALWGSGLGTCGQGAAVAFLGRSQADGTDAQIMTIRNETVSASRASIFSGPLYDTNLAAIQAVTSGSLSFQTAYTAYSMTGCDLSGVTGMTGTAAGSLAAALAACIQADVPQHGSLTGASLTTVTCVPIGYTRSTLSWVKITGLGTCTKIYLGMTIGSSYITAQMTGSDGSPCPAATCDGTVGVYNTFAAAGAPQNSWYAPDNLATASYSVLHYSTYTPTGAAARALGTGDFWLRDACVHLTLSCNTTPLSAIVPVSLTDVAVGADASGCTLTCYITTYTGTNVAAEAMTVWAPSMDVRYRFPSGAPRLTISRFGPFMPDDPVVGTITLPTSGADGLASVLHLTPDTGGYASSPSTHPGPDTKCLWLDHLVNYVANDFQYFWFAGGLGTDMPPGESEALRDCAARYGSRFQWQPWNGKTNQILDPVSPPMFSPLILGGGNGTPPGTGANTFYTLNAGYSMSGKSTFYLPPAAQVGMDAIFWNVTWLWPTDPVAGGFAGGLNDGYGDPNVPVVRMPTTTFAAGGTYPRAQLQNWGLGPSEAANMADPIALEFEPYTVGGVGPSAAPTTPPMASAILQAADCTCFVTRGGGATTLGGSGTQYVPLDSNQAPNATEINMVIVMPEGGKIKAASMVTATPVTGSGGNYAIQLRHNGADVSGWSGNIGASGTGAKPTTTFAVCSVTTSECTASQSDEAFAAGDTISVSVTASGTITTPPAATTALMIEPDDKQSTFLFGRSTSTGPSVTSARYFSAVGLSTNTTASELPWEMTPNLAGWPITHPNPFTLDITNLTVAFVGSSQAGRTQNLRKKTCTALTDTGCTAWGAAADATTAANCTLAAGTIGPSGGGGTAADICIDTTDTYSVGSLDQIELATSGGSTTPGTVYLWSMTAKLK